MSSDNNHSSLIGLLGKIAIVMLIAGGGTAWFTLNSLNSSEIVSQVPVTPDSPKTLKPAVAKSSDALQVYWVKITEDKMKLVPQSIDVTKSNNKTNQLRQALQQLLAGQNNEDVTTSIPAGTKLLGCQVDQKGIHLNFSKQFAQNGGSSSLISRLGQVIYTATGKDMNAKVWIKVEGKPLEILGEGDGLMVQQPLTRKTFDVDYQI